MYVHIIQRKTVCIVIQTCILTISVLCTLYYIFITIYQKSIKCYVNWIEKTLISTCDKFGLNANTTDDTGVWIGDNKIAAIGMYYIASLRNSVNVRNLIYI